MVNINQDFIFNVEGVSLLLPLNFRLIFLCGVVYDKSKESKDKRRILKNYLNRDTNNYPVILEENFSVRGYNSIDLKNLHDVEMLVALFSDTIIIIHESIATGAELGIFASNPNTAQKTLVLYPDEDSVEEKKINTFIEQAFYGLEPILSKDKNLAVFRPVLRKQRESNDRYVYHTFFPNDLKQESRVRNKIDSFINDSKSQPAEELKFIKSKYNNATSDANVVDYFTDEDTVNVVISPSALRSLLFSVLTLKYLRDSIQSKSSVVSVVSALQEELNKTLLNTFNSKLGVDKRSIKVTIKGLESHTFRASSQEGYRKAVGLFVYLLKGMGILDSRMSDKKESFRFTTAHFPAVRGLFAGSMVVKPTTTFSATISEKPDAK